MNLTFAANLTKMIDAGLGLDAAPPETFVAVGRTTEYTDLGPVPIASFETNVEAPLRALSVAMEPIQAGTGDPSPENVRPISGRQSVTVTRTGKNLLAPSTAINVTIGIQNVSLSLLPNVSEITVDTTGLTSSLGYRFNTSDMEVTLPPGTYYLSTNISNQGAGSGIFVFNAETSTILARARLESGGSFTLTDTTTIRLGVSLSADTVSGTYWFQLEIGSSATPYEPYKNIQTVTIQLGQTVYGGSLNVTTGVLTVTKAIVALDTLTWNYESEATRFTSAVSGKANGFDNLICSCYSVPTSSSAADFHDMQIKGITSNNRILVKDSRYTAVADFKASLTATNAQLVYELATPLTITLTPQQITTLIGQNNVWSDGGDVSLTYGTVKYTEGY